MPVKFIRLFLGCFLWGGLTSWVQAENTSAISALPEPLTLQSLLALPSQTSPQFLIQQAKTLAKQSDYQLQTAQDRVQLNVEGRLGWREYAQETQDNHFFALHLSKEIYDFGRLDALQKAMQYGSDAESLLLDAQRDQYKLALMQGFFNVILADMVYRVDNENMAVVFVGLDKAKEVHALGRMSDVEYLKRQANYEAVLVKRTRSAYHQRRTRASLANLAGHPDNLPDRLILPQLKQYQHRKLDTLARYQTQVLANNLALKALRLKLKGARESLEAEGLGGYPKFKIEAWSGKLSSDEQRREGRWDVRLLMDYPLYDGGKVSAKKAKARSAVLGVQAQINALEESLRNQVADLYFKLKLARAERKQNAMYGDYADLYLDYSRGLYENESTTDLGDAMVRLSESNLQTVKQKFTQALNWAQLDYLLGQLGSFHYED